MNQLTASTGAITSHRNHNDTGTIKSVVYAESSAVKCEGRDSEGMDSQVNPTLVHETENFCREGKVQESDRQFDLLVGILESMLLDEQFVSMVNDFGSKYCMEFEGSENDKGSKESTNRLIYTERFVQYNEMIENFMEKYVIERMRDEGFDTITFSEIENMVSNRLEEITGDVADVLLSFSDYEEFKQMMFSHKEHMSVKNNLSSLMTVNHLEQPWPR